MNNDKEIQRCLQLLLWVWFGIVTSFVSVNVVNIAKLETEIKLLEQDNMLFKQHMAHLKYDDLKNK